MSSADWDARYEQADLVWSSTPNIWVERLTSAYDPGLALDLAGGEGRNSLWLVSQGWSAVCVDFSQVALDRATRLAQSSLGNAAQRFSTELADLTTYSPAAATFDLVLVCYLQVPAAQRTDVLRRAATAVAHGGRLVVIAHHSDNIVEGVGGPQDPALLYTADDVVADVLGLGLRTELNDRALRPVTTSEAERFAVDAVYVGRRPD